MSIDNGAFVVVYDVITCALIDDFMLEFCALCDSKRTAKRALQEIVDHAVTAERTRILVLALKHHEDFLCESMMQPPHGTAPATTEPDE